MKRQVLFIGFDASNRDEIQDYVYHHEGEAVFAASFEGAIRILEDRRIATVVLNLQQIADAAILRYINLNKPGIKVLITASEEFDHIINVFSKGSFEVVKQPLRLEELM